MQPAVVLVRTKPMIAPREAFRHSNLQFADDFERLRASPVLQVIAKLRLKSRSMSVHRESAVSRPCSRPKFPNRSKQESREQLPRAASCSNERGPQSRVRSFSGKLLRSEERRVGKECA